MKYNVAEHALKNVQQLRQRKNNQNLLLFLGAIATIILIHPMLSSHVRPQSAQVGLFQLNNLFAQEPPANGSLLEEGRLMTQDGAPLTIDTQGLDHHLIKVVDQSNKLILSVFIRAGKQVSLNVPFGTYKIRYASGIHWYGETYLFGAAGSYVEIDRLLEFKREGKQDLGHHLSLYPHINGNLNTRAIAAQEF